MTGKTDVNGKAQGWIIAGCIVVIGMTGANLLRRTLAERENARKSPVADIEVQVEPEMRGRGKSRRLPAQDNIAASGKTTVQLTGKFDPLISQKVQGFIIDDFRKWVRIPEGYSADGIGVGAEGGVTLSDSDTTGSRTGILVSPPLKLVKPAMEARSATDTMPEGTELNVEISVDSGNGSWSPWVQVSRYTKPDGNLVDPATRPALVPGTTDIPAGIRENEETSASREMIRYRLTLSGSKDKSPVVRDLRVWSTH